MSVAEYTGRRFDLLVLRGATPIGAVQLSQTIFDEESSGEICTGIQKLSQRWAVLFLTDSGSVKFLPDRGNTFLRIAKQGRLRTEADVIAAFNVAAVSIHESLRNEEDDEMPDDERYDGARLDDIALLADAISLTISIFSMAGTTRKVILPISLLPGPLAL